MLDSWFGPFHRIKQYRKRKREEISRQEKDEEEIAATPEEQRPLHKEIKKLNSNLSFSGAAKQSTSLAVVPAKPSNTIAIPAAADICKFAQTYTMAMINETVRPGTFAPTMDKYAKKNGWPTLKHPPPNKAVLQVLGAASTLGAAALTLPYDQAEDDAEEEDDISTAEDTAEDTADDEDINTSLTETPKSSLPNTTPTFKINKNKTRPTAFSPSDPSPRHTRRETDMLEDEDLIHSLIHSTRTNPFFLTRQKTGNPDVINTMVDQKLEEGRITIGELVDLLETKLIKFEPPKDQTNKDLCLTHKIVMTLSRKAAHLNKLVHFKVNKPTWKEKN